MKNRFMHLANDDVDDDHVSKKSGKKFVFIPKADVKLDETKEEIIDICPVEFDKGDGAQHQRTRPSCMTFNVAKVSKPLAAAGKVVDAGNRVVLDQRGSYVEHVATGERMHLRKEKGVYVFDVEFDDGDHSTITLDSGA